MTTTENHVTPKDAAAMILLRDPDDPKVFWVKRSLALKFMGGYQAFPGGQRDAADAEIPVLHCEDREAAAMRVCAVREIFEETGVLIVRGVEKLSAQKIAAMREEFEAGRISFADMLTRNSLQIDAEMLTESSPGSINRS